MDQLGEVRKKISGLGAVGALDSVFMGLFFGGILSLAGFGSLASRMLVPVADDSVRQADPSTLYVLSGLGVVMLLGFGFLFVFGKRKRQALLQLSQSVSSFELMELAVDKHTAGWAGWILRKRLFETGDGGREFVSVVHFSSTVQSIYSELGGVDSDLKAIGLKSCEIKKKVSLPWQFRLLYLLPVVFFGLMGWMSMHPETFPKIGVQVAGVAALVCLYAPFFGVAVLKQKKLKPAMDEIGKLTSRMPLRALTLLAGARTLGASTELLKRKTAKVSGAAEAYREAEKKRNEFSVHSF